MHLVKKITNDVKKKIFKEAWEIARNGGRKKPDSEDFKAARRVVLGLKRERR